MHELAHRLWMTYPAAAGWESSCLSAMPAAPKSTARNYRDILFEVKDQVAWVTINRPRVLEKAKMALIGYVAAQAIKAGEVFVAGELREAEQP